jgi:hypothetical protein
MGLGELKDIESILIFCDHKILSIAYYETNYAIWYRALCY